MAYPLFNQQLYFTYKSASVLMFNKSHEIEQTFYFHLPKPSVNSIRKIIIKNQNIGKNFP